MIQIRRHVFVELHDEMEPSPPNVLMRDLHQGLKTEVLSNANEAGVGVELSLIRHQWGKDDFEYSLHAFPNQWTTAGLQTTDLLGLLGFERHACAFRSGLECFARHIARPFDTKEFLGAFADAYSSLERAEGSLQNCGILLPQQEGWGYFFDSSEEIVG